VCPQTVKKAWGGEGAQDRGEKGGGKQFLKGEGGKKGQGWEGRLIPERGGGGKEMDVQAKEQSELVGGLRVGKRIPKREALEERKGEKIFVKDLKRIKVPKKNSMVFYQRTNKRSRREPEKHWPENQTHVGYSGENEGCSRYIKRRKQHHFNVCKKLGPNTANARERKKRCRPLNVKKKRANWTATG